MIFTLTYIHYPKTRGLLDNNYIHMHIQIYRLYNIYNYFTFGNYDIQITQIIVYYEKSRLEALICCPVVPVVLYVSLQHISQVRCVSTIPFWQSGNYSVIRFFPQVQSGKNDLIHKFVTLLVWERHSIWNDNFV